MGTVVGDSFEDYGNTIEYTASEVRAYERLSGDRIRLYVTEEKGDRHVLLYTVVAPISAFTNFVQKCAEAAGCRRPIKDVPKQRSLLAH
ncbi:hypothetical protein [Bradyrhizobium sp. SZCCHNRI1073]|uniref:hypothetical protein n=1 Tax=Bradyrhizobium sp. SZCCHNRI1073 TaxID=3057280 RepID=UPI002916D22D|nr:hypothetical protein [Bradyrhizobium sp. SZCCHNRI1073]